MKTRKLAAKALSVAVVATTVSGYAMAGDHSITADPSFAPWCSKSFKSQTTSATTGNTDKCGKQADFQIDFSGKLGGGWGYAFQFDPDESGIDTSVSALKGTVLITKDLGNGMSLSLGDTGDASREAHGATWNMNDDAYLNGEGGAKVSYSKGAINASATYGGKSSETYGGNTAISLGADYTMGGLNVGFSYSTHSYDDDTKKFRTDATNTALGAAHDSTGMGLGLSYKASNFVAAFDYIANTVKACAATECQNSTATTADLKTTIMALNANMTSGVFRAGLAWTNSKGDGRGVSTAETDTTTMNVGVRYHPAAWTDTHARFGYTTYSSKTNDVENEATAYTQMKLSIHTSVSML